MKLSKILISACLFYSLSSNASPIVGDGGMSGGGGGTAVTNPVGQDEIVQILFSARQSLYLYFNKLSMYPYPMEPRIDAIKDRTQNVIAQVKIYASEEGCFDKFGNEVDGSIHSPRENTICIDIKKLGAKLVKDNARVQTVALVAHEYAHLLGYDEKDATFIQEWVLKSFTDISQSQGSEMLADMENAFGSIKGLSSGAIHDPGASWNSLCFAATQIEDEMKKINEASENGSLSFYDSEAFKGRNSFVMKMFAFKVGTCRFSDFHPIRDRYQKTYPKYFGSANEVVDEDLAKTNPVTSGPFLGKTIYKIDSLRDARLEAMDLMAYAARTLDKVIMIKSLRGDLVL